MVNLPYPLILSLKMKKESFENQESRPERSSQNQKEEAIHGRSGLEKAVVEKSKTMDFPASAMKLTIFFLQNGSYRI